MRIHRLAVFIASFGLFSQAYVSTTLAEEAKFVGSGKCKTCHFKEHKAWAETRMAKAFELLKPGVKAEEKTKQGLDPAKDYTKDPECLKCHTTGYGKAGGYAIPKAGDAAAVSIAATLEGIGCESCHGAGEKYVPHKKADKAYKWADVAALGLVNPKEATCLTCHNKESKFAPAEGFHFEKEKDKGMHTRFPMKADHSCDHTHTPSPGTEAAPEAAK